MLYGRGSRRAVGGRRAGPRTAQRRTFYESDCQGQFSPLLIAFSSFLLQSAPTDRNAAIVRTRGWAEQSCAADSSSVSPSIHSETISSVAGDHSSPEGVDHGSILDSRPSVACRLFWSSVG